MLITLVGANPQILTVGDPYVELGATALDNIDGDISGSIVIDSSAVNTAVAGSYPVTYNVSDAAGNAAVEVTRTVTVNAAPDVTPPVITLVGANPQILTVGDPYVELGATALDDVDGDISGAIVIDSSAVNTAVAGSYPVTYNVSDAAGNAAIEVTRTVTVNAGPDVTPPVITLVGANPQILTVGDPYVELGATALDNVDGDISGAIVIDSSAVNTAVAGSYPVTYNVSDAAGNAAIEVTRTVTVNAGPDVTPPVITLVGANPQILTVGDPYVELGATALDNVDGDISGAIVIDSSAVNTAVAGSYPVTYNVSDAAGNAAIEVTRTVTVNAAPDVTPPVITLVGANPQALTVGDPYVELGATALDDVDGDISGAIVIDSSAVNTAVAGSYPVTYNVSDAAGNAAIEVTRTVNVSGGVMETLDVSITASSDDAEERQNSSLRMFTGSNDLELVDDRTNNQKVGLRFNGITIPPGSTITNAYVQFQVDEDDTGVVSITIRGEANDNPTTFTSTDGDISARPVTAASVAWSPAPWNTRGEVGPDQRTTDLSPIIQETVDRPGWASGNSLVFIFTGTGERTAEAFDAGEVAPSLHVEYTTP